MRTGLGFILLFLASMPVRDYIMAYFKWGEGISWIVALGGLLVLIVIVMGGTRRV